MLTLVLAASVAANANPSLPELIRSRPVEYSQQSVKKSTYGFTRLQLTISPVGRMVHCNVLVSSGVPDLDEAGCASFKVSKFKPARDAAGAATFGTYNTNILFFLRGKKVSTPSAADLSLAVSHMPSGSGPISVRDAALTVDVAGKVTACKSIVATGPENALDHALCTMAMSRLSFKPVLNEKNKPVASIQSFSVEFSQADAPADAKAPGDASGR